VHVNDWEYRQQEAVISKRVWLRSKCKYLVVLASPD